MGIFVIFAEGFLFLGAWGFLLYEMYLIRPYLASRAYKWKLAGAITLGAGVLISTIISLTTFRMSALVDASGHLKPNIAASILILIALRALFVFSAAAYAYSYHLLRVSQELWEREVGSLEEEGL